MTLSRLFDAIPALGVILCLAGLATRAEEQRERAETYYRQAIFFREMYQQASNESKVTDCIELDGNYVICEKARHGEKR